MPSINEIMGMNNAMKMNPTITPRITTMTGTSMLMNQNQPVGTYSDSVIATINF